MISLNHILPDRNGIDFTSHFDEEREIVIKFIDSHTRLCYWGDIINVFPKCSYWVAYSGRITKFITFVVEDLQTGEILLEVCDYSDTFRHDIRNLDPKNRLKNIGSNLSKKDLVTGLVLWEIFLSGEYNHEHCKVEPGDVVDIGANIGFFSFFSITKGAAQVHSFEPDPKLSNFIQTNFGDLPIHVHNLAVWSEKKDLKLNIHESSVLNSVSVSFDHTDESVFCQGVVLEEWAKENEVKIDFLKIDCEGGEWEIFPNMSSEFLKSIPKIVLEYHIHPPDQLLLIFSENGFQTHHTGNMIWAWQNKKILS